MQTQRLGRTGLMVTRTAFGVLLKQEYRAHREFVAEYQHA